MTAPTKRSPKGAAANHLRTLHNPNAPIESRRSAATQLRRMGFAELADVEVVSRQPKVETLQTLGREAVEELEKSRFTLHKSVTVRQPHSPNITNGNQLATFLDQHRKPDQRAGLLVAIPRVAHVQLGTGIGTKLDAVASALVKNRPSFAPLPFEDTPTFSVKDVDINGRSLTVVKRVSEVGRFARSVLLTEEAAATTLHTQVVQLHERGYTAIDKEWADLYACELSSAAGELAVRRLLDAGDPEVAVPVGRTIWMSQQIRPAPAG